MRVGFDGASGMVLEVESTADACRFAASNKTMAAGKDQFVPVEEVENLYFSMDTGLKIGVFILVFDARFEARIHKPVDAR
jgi:hypothetical protein